MNPKKPYSKKQINLFKRYAEQMYNALKFNKLKRKWQKSKWK